MKSRIMKNLGLNALIMKAVHVFETPVYFNETTRCFISEGCHLHTLRRENLKSHVGFDEITNVENIAS
jgi:hypothetical protein